jgi:NAD(P)-dependent dehydrogenase (short-subunit alcohol dehydrogenase family)
MAAGNMGYKNLELNGKTAVVIGGTSGIGLAIARGLAEAGEDVVPHFQADRPGRSGGIRIEALGHTKCRMTGI